MHCDRHQRLQGFTSLDTKEHKLLQESRIRSEQCSRAASLNELVQWVTDSGRFERMSFMRKSSGMLFFLDVDLQDLVCHFDGATLTDLEQYGEPWPRPANSQPLTDNDVRLPRTLGEFPDFELDRHKSPRYGYSNLWRDFIAEREKPTGQSGPSQASANTATASAPSTTETSTTATTVTTPAPGPVQPVVVAASQASAVTQTTPQFKTTEAAALVEVSLALTLDSAFDVPGDPVSSAAAISQRPPVQAPSASARNVSFPTVASVLIPPPVVSSRPALIPSPFVDTGAAPSQRYASTSTSQYSGAFESVSSKDSYFALVSTPAPQMSLLHESSEFQHGFDDPSMRFPRLVPDFLREFGSGHIEGPQRIRTQALLSALELMGYTLDEQLPSAEHPYQRNLSTKAYLQIASDMPPDRIIVLNHQEFSTLVANAVIEQFPAFSSFVPMRTFPVEKILELSRMIVRDPGGVLRRDPVGPRQLLPATTPSPAMVFPCAADWLQLLASKFSPPTQAASQPSASTADTADTAQPGRSENVATPPDTSGAAAGSSSPSQMPGGAPPEAEAIRADADSDDELQITHQSGYRQAAASWRHVITDALGDFELTESQPTSSSATTPTAAHEHSAKCSWAAFIVLITRSISEHVVSLMQTRALLFKEERKKAGCAIEQVELRIAAAGAVSEASSKQAADANSPAWRPHLSDET